MTTEVRWTDQAVSDLQAIREFIVGEYRLVYKISAGAAIMLTIFRSSRLFPARIKEL